MESASPEPLAKSSSISDSPIYSLNRDLLWVVFSLNSIDRSFYSAGLSEYNPLTTTRRCSQVCVLWRQIILDSPSIWGNCMDLDLLGQEHNDWRDEVLRRTGTAPLCVRAHFEKTITSSTPVYIFLVDLTDAHWERIQEFNVKVQTELIINDIKIWDAFSRPAPYLKEFFLSLLNDGSSKAVAASFPQDTLRLFSDKAPVLAQFSLHDRDNIMMPIGVRPFPSALLSSNLRQLSLYQPIKIAPTDLLTACEKMLHLEILEIVILKLIPDDPRNKFLYTDRKIDLPNLMEIRIASSELDICPAFLGHITAHAGCALSIDTRLSQPAAESLQTETAKVQEMLQFFLQYANGFFNHYRGQDTLKVKKLRLEILPDSFNMTTYPHRNFYLRMVGPADRYRNKIPQYILDMVLNTMTALEFPNTITRLQLSLMPTYPPISNATLAELLLALGSVKELGTTPSSLSYVHKISRCENAAIFPQLKVLYLNLNGSRNKEDNIKPFLIVRKYMVPVAIEVINLTRSAWPLGDLRFLDDFTGLKLAWTQDQVLHEYICGSGNPEGLLLGVDSSTPTAY
ncbi:hypothetical protein BDN70DRAFT_884006 [Pholiota conissans]|uniref:F-box domain-containing protein n=1 Tax=Pholiota conissans TaxID=109636 RepID=A0A9P6CQL3_9AGAR|nr:hypothetical protein BDN70DRAFT_884006 [Pholiota conissans]